MSALGSTLGTQINTPLARAFRQIVTAGWGNMSDGNVEAPTGAFSVITISPAERSELFDAVFEDEPVGSIPTIYPGNYLLEEDSDGNSTLTEYLSEARAIAAFMALQREFVIWDATCPVCGNEGPHVNTGPGVIGEAQHSNVLRCDNGHRWDPTEGLGETP